MRVAFVGNYYQSEMKKLLLQIRESFPVFIITSAGKRMGYEIARPFRAAKRIWTEFRQEEKKYFEKVKNTPDFCKSHPNSTAENNGYSKYSALG